MKNTITKPPQTATNNPMNTVDQKELEKNQSSNGNSKNSEDALKVVLQHNHLTGTYLTGNLLSVNKNISNLAKQNRQKLVNEVTKCIHQQLVLNFDENIKVIETDYIKQMLIKNIREVPLQFMLQLSYLNENGRLAIIFRVAKQVKLVDNDLNKQTLEISQDIFNVTIEFYNNETSNKTSKRSYVIVDGLKGDNPILQKTNQTTDQTLDIIKTYLQLYLIYVDLPIHAFSRYGMLPLKHIDKPGILVVQFMVKEEPQPRFGGPLNPSEPRFKHVEDEIIKCISRTLSRSESTKSVKRFVDFIIKLCTTCTVDKDYISDSTNALISLTLKFYNNDVKFYHLKMDVVKTFKIINSDTCMCSIKYINFLSSSNKYRDTFIKSDFEVHKSQWIEEFFRIVPITIIPQNINPEVSENVPFYLNIDYRVENNNVRNNDIKQELNNKAFAFFKPVQTAGISNDDTETRIHCNRRYKVRIGTRGGRYILVKGNKHYIQ